MCLLVNENDRVKTFTGDGMFCPQADGHRAGLPSPQEPERPLHARAGHGTCMDLKYSHGVSPHLRESGTGDTDWFSRRVSMGGLVRRVLNSAELLFPFASKFRTGVALGELRRLPGSPPRAAKRFG